jgi:LysM repeat protein
VKADGWQRYAAPAAFLLAVTIAVVLVRAGFDSGRSGGKPAVTVVTPPPTQPVTTLKTATTKKKPRKPVQRFTTVQAGDTFSVISRRTGVPVATMELLNPKVSSTTLHIGERIRIK